jgi:hypothetical protein
MSLLKALESLFLRSQAIAVQDKIGLNKAYGNSMTSCKAKEESRCTDVLK